MTAASSRRRRPAGAPDLLEYLSRQVCDQQLHCVLTFDRTLDFERLARATRLALDAEPVLGSRFVERPWRCCWERRDDLDRLELCALERGPAAEERLERFMAAPGDPRSDPLLRVLVLRSDVDTMCIKVDHVVADAGGLRDCAALIASIYARLADEPLFRPEVNRNEDRGFGQALRQFSFAEKVATLLSFVDKAAAQRGKAQALAFPATSDVCATRGFAFRRIGADRLPALRACRLAHRATTNDLLLTAFFRALFAVVDPPVGALSRVQVSVDLRQYLPERRAASICNLASGVFPAIERRADEPFDATLARVRDAMRAIEANRPGLVGAMLIEMVSKLGMRAARQVFGRMAGGKDRPALPLFSNLGGLGGRTDFGGPKVVDGRLVGPIMFPGAFMLALSSSGTAINLSVGFCEPGTSRAAVERLLDLVDRELPQALAARPTAQGVSEK